MIYLFSQIAISLALAAIVGGAVGWLAHRARSGKQISELKSVVSRQQQQVSEAQTEVTILTNDFDELKQHSEAQINALKTDNEKIPALNQNLEKSQLLVRQLLQKHETEMRDLALENEQLTAKARLVDDKERAVTKLQAELDLERRRSSNSDEKEHSQQQDEAEATESESKKAKSNKAESNDDYSLPEVTADLFAGDEKLSSRIAKAEASAGSINKANAAAELEALHSELSTDSLGNNASIGGELKRQSMNGNGSASNQSSQQQSQDDELEPLFESVDQHDDLKQIFGIGPVTEKTLNKLGITAYSQLAELKSHDIEKIADALQIFPGRIERDNWVGGARAQLEEVLEDL